MAEVKTTFSAITAPLDAAFQKVAQEAKQLATDVKGATDSGKGLATEAANAAANIGKAGGAAKQTREEIKQAKDNARFLADEASKAAEKFKEMKSTASEFALATAASMAALAAGVVENVKAAGDWAHEVEDVFDVLGVSEDRAQAFQRLMQRSGQDAMGAAMAISQINRSLKEAADGDEAKRSLFAKIGLDPAKVRSDSKDILDQTFKVTEALKKLSDQERQDVQSGLGVRPGALGRLTRLKDPEGQMEGLEKSNLDTEELKKSWSALKDLAGSTGMLFKQLGSEWAPDITKAAQAMKGLVDEAREWSKENPTLIRDAGRLAVVLGTVASALLSIATAAKGLKWVGEGLTAVGAVMGGAPLRSLSTVGAGMAKNFGLEGAAAGGGSSLLSMAGPIALWATVNRAVHELGDHVIKSMKDSDWWLVKGVGYVGDFFRHVTELFDPLSWGKLIAELKKRIFGGGDDDATAKADAGASGAKLAATAGFHEHAEAMKAASTAAKGAAASLDDVQKAAVNAAIQQGFGMDEAQRISAEARRILTTAPLAGQAGLTDAAGYAASQPRTFRDLANLDNRPGVNMGARFDRGGDLSGNPLAGAQNMIGTMFNPSRIAGIHRGINGETLGMDGTFGAGRQYRVGGDHGETTEHRSEMVQGQQLTTQQRMASLLEQLLGVVSQGGGSGLRQTAWQAQMRFAQ